MYEYVSEYESIRRVRKMWKTLRNLTGIYFALITLFVAVVLAISGAVSIDLLILLEIALVALAIALLRVVTWCTHGSFDWKFLLWLILSIAITLVSAILLVWFADIAGWIFIVFGVYLALILGAACWMKEV